MVIFSRRRTVPMAQYEQACHFAVMTAKRPLVRGPPKTPWTLPPYFTKKGGRDYHKTKKAVDCPFHGGRICSLKRKVRNCGHENGAVCSCAGGGVQNQTRTTQQLQQAAPAVGGHRQQFESVDPHCKCDRPSKCFTVGQSAKPTGRYVALCEGYSLIWHIPKLLR